jgi:hypothetical protein
MSDMNQMTLRDQSPGQVRADEAGTARDEDALSLWLGFQVD